MATRIFSAFDTTPANMVADIKAAILTSDAWSNPAGSRVVATTTRGADMVVDLADAAASNQRMQMGVYRTSGLSDKVTRYLQWRDTGGSTSDPIHLVVSAGKEHLYLQVTAPYTGEANASSNRGSFFISDLVPYFSTDSVAAVVCGGQASDSLTNNHYLCHVSRNAANNASWVTAYLGALGFQGINSPVNHQMPAADGDVYLSPYVVVETLAGLRGRLAEFFWAGWTDVALAGPGQLSKVTVGGNTYIVQKAFNGGQLHSAFGNANSSNVPMVAVPFS